MELVFEMRLGVWQQFAQWNLCRLCWNGLQVHKQRNFLLDNDFSPAYSLFVKKDRLQDTPSIIC